MFFQRDTSKNRVYVTYPYQFIEEKNYQASDKQAGSFKKSCYMIFSNSLLRLKANKHLFHILIKYPNLSLDKILSRNSIQLRIANGTDHAQSCNMPEKDPNDEIDDQSFINRQKLCIPMLLNSQLFSMTTTLSGSVESGEKSDPISFLGRGGFGEVRAGKFIGKDSAMKKFYNEKRNKERKTAETSNHRSVNRTKEDHVRELRANISIDAKFFPKFYGLAYLKNSTKNPVLLTSCVGGKKLSQCYKDITEDYPEIIPQIIMEICTAITFIHDKGVFHGDLSPNNVMIDHNPKTEEVKVYIIDFGLADSIKRGNIWGHTIDFTSYEAILDKSHNHLDKIDIFSFGSILFNIFFRTSFVNYIVK